MPIKTVKKMKLFWIFGIILILFLIGSHIIKAVAVSESQTDFINSLKNPHPPQSVEDKNRVAFAELAVNTLLKSPEKKEPSETSPAFHNPIDLALNITQSCLEITSCHEQNKKLQDYIGDILNKYGSLIEIRHAHIIPWSFEKFKNRNPNHVEKTANFEEKKVAAEPMMPVPILEDDEYMVHIYANFANGKWYHLDVIVSEDAKGNLFFRRFFLFEIQSENQTLPEGAVCELRPTLAPRAFLL